MRAMVGRNNKNAAGQAAGFSSAMNVRIYYKSLDSRSHLWDSWVRASISSLATEHEHWLNAHCAVCGNVAGSQATADKSSVTSVLEKIILAIPAGR